MQRVQAGLCSLHLCSNFLQPSVRCSRVLGGCCSAPLCGMHFRLSLGLLPVQCFCLCDTTAAYLWPQKGMTRPKPRPGRDYS